MKKNVPPEKKSLSTASTAESKCDSNSDISIEDAQRYAKEALAKFDQKEMDKLYGYAAKLCNGNAEDGAEIVNDMLMRVLSGARPYDPQRGAFKTYIGLQLRSLCQIYRTEYRADALDKKSHQFDGCIDSDGVHQSGLGIIPCPRMRADALFTMVGGIEERVMRHVRTLPPKRRERAEEAISKILQGALMTDVAREMGCSQQLIGSIFRDIRDMDAGLQRQKSKRVSDMQLRRFNLVVAEFEAGARSIMQACAKLKINYNSFCHALGWIRHQMPELAARLDKAKECAHAR